MPLLMGTDPVDLAALTIRALIGRPAGPAFWRRRKFHLAGWLARLKITAAAGAWRRCTPRRRNCGAFGGASLNGHPHYEIVPVGQVFDGADEVMGYYRTGRVSRSAPRQCPLSRRRRRGHRGVRSAGHQSRPVLRHAAQGERVRCASHRGVLRRRRRIVNERVYFDTASLLAQIGRGDLPALIAGGQR
jgi:hypothetical protein